MFRFIFGLLVCMLVTSCTSNSSGLTDRPDQAKDRMKWAPARYAGLVVGEATAADVRRALGEPLDSGPAADQDPDESDPVMWSDYGHDTRVLPGRLSIYMQRGGLVTITVAPDHPSKEDVIKFLGQDYEIVRYSSCPTEGTVSDIYINPEGEDEHVVYPRRGISGFVENGEIREVIFTSDRPGYDSSEDCQEVVTEQER